MEVPEKIYLNDSMTTGTVGELYPEWFDAKVSDRSIEYIRTDTFIEKEVKWLMDNIQDYTDDGMGEHSFVLVQDLKEHFKNYMKGE